MQATTVVGYQDSATCGEETFVGTAATFAKISGTMTLNDIKVGPADGVTEFIPPCFKILFLNQDCGTMVVDEETMGSFSPEALEAYPDSDLAFAYVPGLEQWFLYVDLDETEGLKFPMNDYPIPAGQGLIMNTLGAFGMECGIKLQYSGQVSTDYVDVTCMEECFKLTGNIAPKAMTLGDFKVGAADDVTEFIPPCFKILFLKEDCGTKVVDEETMGAFSPDALEAYPDSDLAFAYVPGLEQWFLYVDLGETEGLKFPMNDYPIPASQGLIMNTLGAFGLECGVKISLPPAILKPVAD